MTRAALLEELLELCSTLERSPLKWDRIASLCWKIRNHEALQGTKPEPINPLKFVP